MNNDGTAKVAPEYPDIQDSPHLMPNLLEQRFDFAVRFHKTLSNPQRMLALLVALDRGDRGIRPMDLARTLHIDPSAASRALQTLNDVFLVAGRNEMVKGRASDYVPTKMAYRWLDFEQLGEPDRVLAANCRGYIESKNPPGKRESSQDWPMLIDAFHSGHSTENLLGWRRQ